MKEMREIMERKERINYYKAKDEVYNGKMKEIKN